jgi:hypothetical protein
MEKEFQTSIVHHQGLGEGQRFADKASQALSERIIPTFHMSGLPSFLSGSGVLLFWDHRLVCRPEISEAVASTVREGNSLP